MPSRSTTFADCRGGGPVSRWPLRSSSWHRPVPPFTAGFLAKFSVIGSAVDSEHWAIAVVAMLSAVVSAFVYLRVVATIYFGPTEADNGRDRSSLPLAGRLALGVAVVGTLGLGLLPKWATDWSEKATVVLAQPGQPDR